MSGCSHSMEKEMSTVALGINISKTECKLIETGSGYKENHIEFIGNLNKRSNKKFSCAVEVREDDFKKSLGTTCFLRGFNRTAGDFETNELRSSRQQSCDFRQLRNGKYYFLASGTQLDSCDWICIK